VNSSQRATLERVFADPVERGALEALTHPVVGLETSRLVQEQVERGAPLVFYDVPLLYEAGLEPGMDGVIVVWVPPAVQLERLMARDNLERAAAEARLRAQLPIDEKRRRATWMVDSRRAGRSGLVAKAVREWTTTPTPWTSKSGLAPHAVASAPTSSNARYRRCGGGSGHPMMAPAVRPPGSER